MVVLCANLTTALLDTSGISSPVFGSGCHVVRSTLTNLREPPGGEGSGIHLLPRMSEKLRTWAGGERPWGAGMAIISALAPEEGRTEAREAYLPFAAQPKDTYFAD